MQDNPLLSAQAELESLLEKKAEIERRIGAVRKSISILEPFYQQESHRGRLQSLSAMMTRPANIGITEAVERALMSSSEGLSPTQVRDLLKAHDYPVHGINPMATVHTVLKRLASRPDGSVVTAVSGKTVYKYVAPPAADNLPGKARSSDRSPRAAGKGGHGAEK